jgi:two-component system, LytTR family, response regulator
MIRVIIIDDEPLAVSIVQDYLKKFPQISVVEVCENGFEGVKAIAQHKPDLVFLDIQMPKINGFEMLELIDEPPSVIFTTAFDEYAIRAFEAHAIDYLLKPFSEERFSKALEKWLSQRNDVTGAKKLTKLTEELHLRPEEQHRIVVRTGSNIRIIPVQDIHYIEALDDYVKLFTADEHFLKKQTMRHFEQALSQAQFVRVHRSYIVSIQQITRLEPMGKDTWIALLKNGTRIPLSKNGYHRLKEVLGI